MDEHGDRKWGKYTARVGSLWSDEEVYYPLEVEPYTPAHRFGGGKSDLEFRTKLEIARQLVERSVEMGVGFRAVVADSFYGEDQRFKRSLGEFWVSPTFCRPRTSPVP